MGQLTGIGAEAIPDLLEMFELERLTSRLAAAETLEMIGEEAVPALIGVLLDGSPIARRHAAGTLGQIKDRRAVPPLMAALKNGSPELRRASALALSTIRDPSAVPLLIEALEDDDPTVRGHAAEALGRIDPGDLAGPVIAGLAGRLSDVANFLSSERRICDAAAGALKRIGSPEALHVLETHPVE